MDKPEPERNSAKCKSQDHMKLIPRTICHVEVGGPPMLEPEALGELEMMCLV